jgi:hypothetical protein
VRGIELKDDTNMLRALYMSGDKAAEMLEKKTLDKLERDKFLSRNNLDKNDLSNSARAEFDEKQKFFFDYHNPGVTAYIQTDRNRGEFLAFNRQQTVSVGMKL